MNKDITTIKLTRTNRDRLAARGSKDTSFDSIVSDLLDKTESKL